MVDHSGASFALALDMENSQTTINGIIVPVEWNEVGKITGLAVVTFDEDKFFIADSRIARTLMSFLRKTVTLSGKVSVHGSQKKIRISQFQVHNE